MAIPPQNPAPVVPAGAPATPFLDRMPELVAHLDAPHGPDDWRARTQAGEEVLARRLQVPDSERTTMVDRLRWLWEADATGLLPLRGAATNPEGVWVLLRPVPGSPLGAVAGPQPLTPAETVAAGRSLFRGLATLHRIGLGQLVVPRTILIGADGKAHLDGPWLPVDPGGRAGQVRALGETLIQAMGITARPEEELTAAERQSPGLVATLRGVAGGTAVDAATAAALLEESAGALAAPPQLARSEGSLADRVKRLLSPSAVPGSRRPVARVRRVTVPTAAAGPAPPRAKPPPPVRIGPRMSEKSAWNARPAPRRQAEGSVRASTVLAGSLIGLVLLVLVFGAWTVINKREQLAATPPPHAATPTPAPTAPPSLAPSSAAPVASVVLTTDQVGSCAAGQACQVQVRVNFSSGSHSAAWNFYVTNLCTGKVTQVGSGSEDAPYPAYVYADNTVNIPAGTSLELIAKTTSPAVAASSPLKIGSGSC